MDNAIVADEIPVQSPDGVRLAGIQALTEDSRKLVFRPLSRWEQAEYRLVFSRASRTCAGTGSARRSIICSQRASDRAVAS